MHVSVFELRTSEFYQTQGRERGCPLSCCVTPIFEEYLVSNEYV